MKKKILFSASTAIHILNFHQPYLKYFKENGWEVHVAVSHLTDIPFADQVHDIQFTKNPISPKNITAIRSMRKLLISERYDVISMHTTLAAFVTRIAQLFCKKNNTVIINTVHGYLFYKDMNKIKAGIYFLIEWFLARYTHVIATMNQSDFEVTKKYFKCKDHVYLVPGMGIDLDRISFSNDVNKAKLRAAYDIKKNTTVLTYTAEFSNRKNQTFLIQAFKEIVKKYPNTKLFLLGDGKELEKCKAEAENLIENKKIIFTGYVKNVQDYLAITDIAVSTSKSEGLPFNIMEAMQHRLPILVSRVKGHTDLIEEGKNGFLFNLKDNKELIEKFEMLQENKELQAQQGKNNKNKVQKYSLDKALPANIEIYKDYI